MELSQFFVGLGLYFLGWFALGRVLEGVGAFDWYWPINCRIFISKYSELTDAVFLKKCMSLIFTIIISNSSLYLYKIEKYDLIIEKSGRFIFFLSKSKDFQPIDLIGIFFPDFVTIFISLFELI